MTPHKIEGTLAIPLTTFLLLRDLKVAETEDEKKPIRVKLLDILHEGTSTEEHDAIVDALVEDHPSD